jgi:hypothetical protein
MNTVNSIHKSYVFTFFFTFIYKFTSELQRIFIFKVAHADRSIDNPMYG